MSRINQLDAEFDHHLASMKKYILDLKDRKYKNFCAAWVKKLCNVTENENVIPKHIRNGYSSRLLDMLRSGQLEFPFDDKPPAGPLKPLEEIVSKSYYMSEMNDHHPLAETNSDENGETNYESQDDMVYHYQHNTKFVNPREADESHRKTPSSTQTSYEYQLKQIEAKFKEERLSIQQQHSNEIQKLLDRKNSEIESLKAGFNKKRKEYEDNIESLIKKIHILKNEISAERNGFEKTTSELKMKIETSIDKSQLESDKKINEIVNKYERDKIDTQRQHTKIFQDLVDETNFRLKKVESEYNQQLIVNEKVIIELENKTQMLKNEIEKNIHIIGIMEKDMNEKDDRISCLESKLNESNKRKSDLENEIIKVRDSHKKELHELNAKLDGIANTKNKEYDMVVKRMNQTKEELKNNRLEYEKNMERLNKIIKEKDTALVNVTNAMKQQKIKAELALNEMKREIDDKSNRMCDELKDQEQVYSCQIEKLEKEKLVMKHEFENEKQKMIRHHENVYDQLKIQYQQQILDTNQANKSKLDEVNKTKTTLEMRIVQLEQELNESNNLRKQQIIELGLLREDEKSRMNRGYEKEIDAYKIKYDQEMRCMRQRIKDQKDELENEIRLLIKQSDERCRKFADKLTECEDTIRRLESENDRMRECMEKEKCDLFRKMDEEKLSLRKCFQSQINNLEKDLNREIAKNRSLERKLKSTNSEYDQYITNLKMQYEEKLKSLMPVSLKKDLEETICSLKAQIDCLQKRTALLQSELDERNQLVNSSSCSASI